MGRTMWSKTDDEQLRTLHDKYYGDFTKIWKKMDKPRTAGACSTRWKRLQELDQMQEIFDLSDDAGSDGSSDKDAQAGKSSAAAVKSQKKRRVIVDSEDESGPEAAQAIAVKPKQDKGNQLSAEVSQLKGKIRSLREELRKTQEALQIEKDVSEAAKTQSTQAIASLDEKVNGLLATNATLVNMLSAKTLSAVVKREPSA